MTEELDEGTKEVTIDIEDDGTEVVEAEIITTSAVEVTGLILVEVEVVAVTGAIIATAIVVGIAASKDAKKKERGKKRRESQSRVANTRTGVSLAWLSMITSCRPSELYHILSHLSSTVATPSRSASI